MPSKLKIRRQGNSLGVTLPKDLISELGYREGDELYVVRTPEGMQLTRFDPDFEEALEIGREVMRRYPNALKKLAEG